MVMKRRNVYNFIATNKLRRALKRNKTNDGVGFIVRLFGGIGMLILFDFLSDLRVELLYPFYLFVSEFNDIFRFKGFLYLLGYMFLALSIDMLCYYFLTIQWLLFTSSSIVWFQFTWDTERGFSSLSFLPVWLTLCCFEFFVRGRHVKLGYSITQEISRPFAAHGVGHPIFMLCFFCKNFIFYRIKVFHRRVIRRENETLMTLMRDALSIPVRSSCSDDDSIDCLARPISGAIEASSENDVRSNGHSLTSNGSPSISTHISSENGYNPFSGTSTKNPNGHSLSLSSSTKLISNQFHSSSTLSPCSPSSSSVSNITSSPPTSQSLSLATSSSPSSSSSSFSLSSTHSSTAMHCFPARRSSSPGRLPAEALVTSGRRFSNLRSMRPETLLQNRILVFFKKPLSYYDSLKITSKVKSSAGRLVRFLGIVSVFGPIFRFITLVLSICRSFPSVSKDSEKSSDSDVQDSSASSSHLLSSRVANCSTVLANSSCPANQTTPSTLSASSSVLQPQQYNGHLSNVSPNKDSQIDGQVSKRKNSLETNSSKQKANKQTSRSKASNGSLQSTMSTIDSELQQQFDNILKTKDDQITNLKYQNNKLKCDVEITQQARDDLTIQLRDAQKAEKEADKRLKNAQNEIQTLQKRIQTLNQAKQQDKQAIQKLEKSLEDERKKHRLTAEQQSQAEARAASAMENFNKANTFAETWKNKCRDSCNQQRKDLQNDIHSLQQELAIRKEKEARSEQIILDLRERNSRLNLMGNVYQEKCITLEKQLSCMNSEKYEMKLILTDRENEILELRSKLHRYTNKPFSSPTGNGFPSSSDFDQQIAATNRELVNRCFSSCSPGTGQSQAQRAISPSAFSSPTPPMSMLGQLSVQNISPGTGPGSSKLNPAAGFHLNASDTDDLLRGSFRLSRDSQMWPQNSSTAVTGSGSSNTIIRLCDSSNLGAVGSERESANGRHSSQSNCSINNRINGQPTGPGIGNGFTTAAGVLPASMSSSSSPLGSSNIASNGLSNVGTLPGKLGGLNAPTTNSSKTYDNFFGDDSVFDLPTVSNNSQGFF